VFCCKHQGLFDPTLRIRNFNTVATRKYWKNIENINLIFALEFGLFIRKGDLKQLQMQKNILALRSTTFYNTLLCFPTWIRILKMGK